MLNFINLHGFSFRSDCFGLGCFGLGCFGRANKVGFSQDYLWGFNFKTNRSFSTTFSSNSKFFNNYFGLDYTGEKLVINSTPNEVVFENDKAVLMLPPLKSYKLVIKNITEKGLIVNSHHFDNMIKSKDFVVPLLKMIDNLNCGFYKFDIYYFSNLNNDRNCLQMVYTFDLHNKNCLHLIPGSYGYTVLCTSFGYLNDNKDRSIFFAKILYSISNRLKEFFENDILNSTMDLNKDTLLVITKLNKDEHDNYDLMNIQKLI